MALLINFVLTKRTLVIRLILLALGFVGVGTTAYIYYDDKQRARDNLVYWDSARRNGLGLLGLAGQGLKESSNMNNIIDAYVRTVLGHLDWDCTSEAMKAYDAAIIFDRTFPFPYYYKASCERAASCAGTGSGDEWVKDSQAARRILLITTQIPGHHANHDQVLKLIEDGIPLLKDGTHIPGGRCP